MTQIEAFQKHLRSIGFNIVNDTVAVLNLIPSYYKAVNGNHYLVSNILVSIFGGSNTKDGDLGCVVFQYQAKLKEKGCRNVVEDAGDFKMPFVAENAENAIKMFETWHRVSQSGLSLWRKII